MVRGTAGTSAEAVSARIVRVAVMPAWVLLKTYHAGTGILTCERRPRPWTTRSYRKTEIPQKTPRLKTRLPPRFRLQLGHAIPAKRDGPLSCSWNCGHQHCSVWTGASCRQSSQGGRCGPGGTPSTAGRHFERPDLEYG